MSPPKKRNSENKPLPKRWRKKGNAYYYRVPKGLEYLWDNKTEFPLGVGLEKAYKTWACRIQSDGSEIKTMGQAFDRYALEVTPKKSDKSQESDRLAIRRLRPVFGSMPPAIITSADAYQYYDIATNKHGVGKKSAKNDISILSNVLTHLVKWGVIGNNQLFKQVIIENNAPRTRYVEDWEVDELLKTKSKIKNRTNELIKCYVRFKLMTGWSRIDILLLSLKQIKDDGIHMTRSKTEKTTGKGVIVSWSPELKALVEEIKSFAPGRVGDVYLFVTREGKPYCNPETHRCNAFDTSWQNFMKRALETTKLEERFHEHDLRAKVATDSESLQEAADRLTHASTETTKRIYQRKKTVVTPLNRDKS